MQIRTFSIPTANAASDTDALNTFLRSKRVLQVHKQFREAGAQSCWEILVEYLDPAGGAGGGVSTRGSKVPKIDYKEILPEATFARFAVLRELRKQVATEEAIPAYAIFTNEQLAEIAKLDEASLSSMGKVEGIGPAPQRRLRARCGFARVRFKLALTELEKARVIELTPTGLIIEVRLAESSGD